MVWLFSQFHFFCTLQDILSALRIPRALVLETSFDRSNLKYEVTGKSKEPLKQLGNLLLDRFKNLSGIVYCLSKSECVDVSKFLNEKCKIKTVYYHAGLASRQRVAVQKRWRSGEVDIVCATIAFGMGIDKPDVVSSRGLWCFSASFHKMTSLMTDDVPNMTLNQMSLISDLATYIKNLYRVRHKP